MKREWYYVLGYLTFHNLTREIPVPVHVNLTGSEGGGKTTIALMLAARHRTLWIPRVTTRAPRPGEIPGTEYFFFSPEQFAFLVRTRKMLKEESRFMVVDRNEMFAMGILDPSLWPKPDAEHELVLSVFGRSALYIKKQYVPEMITVLLQCDENERRRRRKQ